MHDGTGLIGWVNISIAKTDSHSSTEENVFLRRLWLTTVSAVFSRSFLLLAFSSSSTSRSRLSSARI
jgi:hypothetical protein